MVEIKLFGTIEVLKDGERITRFRSVKTRVLLAYLIVQSRPLTRSYLAGLLWPEVPESDALGHLRRALHNVNKLLPDVLETDRKTVAFRPKTPTNVDIIQFVELEKTQASWEAAIALANAPFLEGVYVENVPEIETWIVGEQEHWRQRLVSLIEQTALRLSASAPQQALRYAQQWVQADPWQEAAHRQLMLLLAQLGRKQAAVKQFERCVAVLEEELGATVSAETAALHDAIQAGEHDPTAVAISRPSGKRSRGESILHEKVKTFWLEGVLQNSLVGQSRLSIERHSEPEAVSNPWRRVLRAATGGGHKLPPDQLIGQAFDNSTQALLILGEPGSGKTTQLLELLQQLSDRAAGSVSEPIPVIFNLSSWRSGSFFDWLLAELNEKYLIPRREGQRWLSNNRLALLLDGLDEVKPERQRSCVQAINRFRQSYGLTPMALCCRTQPYARVGDKLQLSAAITLSSLTEAQVSAAVLANSQLSDVLADDGMLRTLAQSPLMLSILQVTYQEVDAKSAETKPHDSMRKQVFATYIERMFERRGQPAYAHAATRRWLGWLARHLAKEQQTIFLIEQLQPRALASQQQRQIYTLLSRLTIALTLAFTTVLPVLRLYDWFDKLTHRVPPPLPNFYLSLTMQLLLASLVVALLLAAVAWWWGKDGSGKMRAQRGWRIGVGVALTLAIALAYWLSFAVANGLSGAFTFAQYNGQAQLLLIGAIVFGLRGIGRKRHGDIYTVAALGWSGRRALSGAAIGALAVVPFFFLVWGDWSTGQTLLFTLVLWGLVAGALLGGLTRRVVAQPTRPNHGMWLSVRHALITGSALGLLIGGLGEWVNYVAPLAGGTSNFTPGTTFVSGIYSFVAVAFWFGAIDLIFHATLRLLLWREGAMPANYARFLDYAVRLSFLRRVGGGYIFAHKLLQEHFAELPLSALRRQRRLPVPLAGIGLVAITLLLFRVLPVQPTAFDFSADLPQPQQADGVNCDLVSEPSLISAELSFINASTVPVGLYFKAYTGADWSQTAWPIQPSKLLTVPTYIGHAWCVRDTTSGLPIHAFTITQPQQTVSVQAP